MVNKNLQHLSFLLKKNHVFAGFHYLNNLPSSVVIPQRENLLLDLQIKIETAKTLTAGINSILNEGDYPQALHLLKKAQSIVEDFPNIQTDIDFISASITTTEKNLKEAKLLASKGCKQQVTDILKTAQGIDKNNNKISEVEKRLQSSQRKKSFKIIGALVLAIILPFVYFSFEHLTLQQAENLSHRAEALKQLQKYAEAEHIFTQMNDRLQFVNITGQAKKNRLQNSALADAVTFDKDKPIDIAAKLSRADSGNMRYVDTLIEQAEDKKKNRDFNGAIELYSKAIDFSESNIHVHPQTLQGLFFQREDTYLLKEQELSKRDSLKFQEMVKTADTLFRLDNWRQASISYKTALTFAENQGLRDFEGVTLLQRKYIISRINHNIENGEVAYNQNRYLDAISAFEECLLFMRQEQFNDENLYSSLTGKLHNVKQKLFLVQLSKIVQSGDILFTDKEYDLSLGYYNQGMALLDSKDGLILGANNQVAQKQIKKKMAAAQESLLVSAQSKHLVATYKNILRHNFNLSRNIHFNQPKIVFLGNKDNHLIYTVSAFGARSSAVAAIKYEVNYKFNIHTGKWDVNDIRLEV